MKFTYQGVEYRIEFQYETKKTGKKKVRNYTFARIKTGNQDTEQIVTEGKVARYQYDAFDKEQARQYALEAALTSDTVEPMFGYNGDAKKGFRSAARSAYYRRPGGLDYERAVNKGLIARVPVQETAKNPGHATATTV